MKRIRYELTIKKGNTLRIERVHNPKVEKLGYQSLKIIEEGEE